MANRSPMEGQALLLCTETFEEVWAFSGARPGDMMAISPSSGRRLIRLRTGEALAALKLAGVTLGRPQDGAEVQARVLARR